MGRDQPDHGVRGAAGIPGYFLSSAVLDADGRFLGAMVVKLEFPQLEREWSHGNDILLVNSYWSDFNGKDERSWQLGYGFDFGAVGIPGLTYNIAYVRGSNIDDGSGDGRGTEREIYNQAKYVVQSGPVKDLSVRLRGSWLRVSSSASDYNVGGNEVRVFVDYPISIF